MKTYIDPPAEKIAEQLEKVLNLKRNNPRLANMTKIIAWEKWCTSYEYRKRSWEFSQRLSESLK